MEEGEGFLFVVRTNTGKKYKATVDRLPTEFENGKEVPRRNILTRIRPFPCGRADRDLFVQEHNQNVPTLLPPQLRSLRRQSA